MRIVALLRRSLPVRQRQALRRAARRVRHFGRGRFCPVCRARLRAFLADARTGRSGATCPVCGSQERHRSIWPFLVAETPLAAGGLRVLHVAPEGCLEPGMRRVRPRAYVTLDLARRDVAVRGDLARLGLASASFDFVLCNHVLEHVADDRAAMREIYRVLAPGGWAVVTVPGPDPALGLPPRLARTIEDPAVTSAEERRRRYGHPGHLRQYGSDLAERLRAEGFDVALREVGAGGPASEARRCGRFDAYPVFVCRKPAAVVEGSRGRGRAARSPAVPGGR